MGESMRHMIRNTRIPTTLIRRFSQIALVAALPLLGCGAPGVVGPTGPQGERGQDAVVSMYEFSVPISCFSKDPNSAIYFCQASKMPTIAKDQAVLGYVFVGPNASAVTWWHMPFNQYYSSTDPTAFVHFGFDINTGGKLFLDATNSKGGAPLSGTGAVSYRFYVLPATQVITLSQQVNLGDLAAVEQALAPPDGDAAALR